AFDSGNYCSDCLPTPGVAPRTKWQASADRSVILSDHATQFYPTLRSQALEAPAKRRKFATPALTWCAVSFLTQRRLGKVIARQFSNPGARIHYRCTCQLERNCYLGDHHDYRSHPSHLHRRACGKDLSRHHHRGRHQKCWWTTDVKMDTHAGGKAVFDEPVRACARAFRP